MFSITGRIAVVTGGGSGIGLACARRLASAGAAVVVADCRDCGPLVEAFGASFVHTDVGEEKEVAHLIACVASRHGRIDVLVNNAGIGEPGASAVGLTGELIERHMRVNLLGAVYGTKHAVPYMQRGGSIINVASILGLMGIPTGGAYVASKFALVGLTKTTAIELGPYGLRVNCVCPGTIDTPMNQQPGSAAELALVRAMAPLGRMGMPEEVAALIHFLAAPDCGYLTGQAIVIDGGWLAGTSLAVIDRVTGRAAQ